ncbi:hypothetical protein VTN49DRAFT_2797 [Thermomyces lanuginosus]|uniref:uncharacterized protein n=1 Tax=Thermomyces lanuginosus TaxID=5541 RepID=UPI0037442216
MLQEPVCCKKKTFLEKAMDGSLLTAEENCSPLPGISDFVCEHAPDVWCCYRVNKIWVCTSVATLMS